MDSRNDGPTSTTGCVHRSVDQSLCWSVGQSVCWSVGLLVGNANMAHLLGLHDLICHAWNAMYTHKQWIGHYIHLNLISTEVA